VGLDGLLKWRLSPGLVDIKSEGTPSCILSSSVVDPLDSNLGREEERGGGRGRGNEDSGPAIPYRTSKLDDRLADFVGEE
jgi:hypothetical protein